MLGCNVPIDLLSRVQILYSCVHMSLYPQNSPTWASYAGMAKHLSQPSF